MRLNYKRTILVGFAFFLISTFWGAYDAIVPKILDNKFGLNQTWSGAVMALDNVLAVFMLPLFGGISDRVRTRFGRRTPFVFFGTLVASALFVVLGFVNSLLGFIGVLFLVLVAMSTFRSPAVALMPDVTVKPLRSKANAIINLMGTAGGIIALLLGIVFDTGAEGKKDFPFYIIAIVGVMLVGLLVFLLTVKEPLWAKDMEEESEHLGLNKEMDAEDKKRALTGPELKSLCFILASVALWYMGYNAVTSRYSVYAEQVLAVDFNTTLIVAQAAAVIAYIPVGIIASRIGRKKSILSGIIMLAAAFVIGSFMRSGVKEITMFPIFALAGIGWATINVNSFPMVVELAKGGDVGRYTGFYYTASMSAQIVTPFLSGVLMDNVAWEILFPYAALFAAFSFVTMLFVKHGDSRPEKTGALESLGAGDD